MQARFLRDLPHSSTGLRCRLVFMDLRAGRMILDAVVSSGFAGRPSGDPLARRGFEPAATEPGMLVTVVAQMPTRPWGLAAKATLERWIEESREVDLRVRRRRARRSQVEASSDEASMVLDLAA